MKRVLTRLTALMLVAALILSVTPAVSAADDELWTDYAATAFAGGSGTAADPYVINTAQQLALLAQYANVQEYGYYDAHYVLGSDIDLSAHQWNPIGVVEGTQGGAGYYGIGFDGIFDGKNHTISGLTITRPIKDCNMYGLFGMNLGTVKNLTLKSAKICFNSADKGWISANGMGSDIQVGGLCAYSQGPIQNCDVTNITVDVTAVMSLSCGGALGSLNSGKMNDVHVTGSVSGNSGRAIWIGGCIGSISNDVVVEKSGFVGNVKSQNNGTVELEGLTEEGYSYVHYAGGFCGSAGRANENITVKNCYADVKLDSVSITATQDVGGFAGAIGIVHGKAVYENLVCRPTIKCNDSTVAIDETYFWRGEMGTWYSWQEDSTNWVYKNLMVLTADTVYTTNSATDYCQTTPYSLSETDISTLLFEKLGFSDSIWTVGSSGMPKVKDQIVKIVLSAPTIQVSNNASTGKPVISWSKVDGAVKYELYQATSKNGTYKKIGTATGTSITNKSAVTGKMYYYKVKAVDASGNRSEFSNVVNRTCDLPQPVVSVTNVASTGKVKLSWPAIEGAAKYELYRATSKNGTYTKIGTTKNSYITNTSGVAGTLYYYKVRALHGTNTGAHSAYSAIVNSRCDLPQPKVTATNVASSGKVKLTWEKIEGAAKYQVYRATSKSGEYTKIYTTTGTSCTNTSGVAGTTYYYKVIALHSNSAANSAYSAIVERTCDLPQPTLTVTLDSNGRPKLTWSKVEGAAKYQVYRATSKSGTYSLIYTTTSGTSVTNKSNLVSGTTYYYKVIAVHSKTAANSAYSAIKSVTVK